VMTPHTSRLALIAFSFVVCFGFGFCALYLKYVLLDSMKPLPLAFVLHLRIRSGVIFCLDSIRSSGY
jgi:hypothetical protein